MTQYSFFKPKNILSVSELTSYLRQVLERDEILQDLWVTGEISNFSKPSSGHLYFTLKDNDAAVRCVMWRFAAGRLSFTPGDGVAVEAHGSMGIYEVSGQVQLYVDTLIPAGEGALFQEYLRLKAKLEAEGLFDPAIKRPLPAMPKRIGIVTSPTGAALQDMRNTIQRRFPIAEVILSPTAVQGAEAPLNIVKALARLNREVHPDVILIGRGGGSIEDLWAFNDEAVVRAVAASEAPIVSGVGHETDFTLTDFAADLRAPTPTAAAEVATPDKYELLAQVAELANKHKSLVKTLISDLRWDLSQLEFNLVRLSPKHTINTYRQRLDEMVNRLERSAFVKLERKKLRLENLQQSLKSINPIAVLNRGYAIVTRKADQSVVKRVEQVRLTEELRIRVSQGSLDARVTKKIEENENDQ
jgi:exodeoxyribonuclease VII large subunit